MWPDEFPAQRASNAENVSIWWRHNGKRVVVTVTNHNKSQQARTMQIIIQWILHIVQNI